MRENIRGRGEGKRLFSGRQQFEDLRQLVSGEQAATDIPKDSILPPFKIDYEGYRGIKHRWGARQIDVLALPVKARNTLVRRTENVPGLDSLEFLIELFDKGEFAAKGFGLVFTEELRTRLAIFKRNLEFMHAQGCKNITFKIQPPNKDNTYISANPRSKEDSPNQ